MVAPATANKRGPYIGHNLTGGTIRWLLCTESCYMFTYL